MIVPRFGFALSLVLLTALMCPSSSGATERTRPVEPADIAQERYTVAISDLRAHVIRFRATLETLSAHPADLTRLRREVADLRATYKRLEFLLDYMHPGSSARLNPPPIDRSDFMPDATTILPPEGLQILLEVAHEDDALSVRKDHLIWIAMRLDDAARELTDASMPVFDDRMLFEAMQNQVIRVMATGIAGFDAPYTPLALPESRLSLEVLAPVIDLYAPALRARDAALARRLDDALARAVETLPPRAASDADAFDAFDRLAFIRNAGDPLYAALIDAQHTLGIATFADLAPFSRPVSTTARKLFDPAFLDAHYYSLTPGERMDTVVAALGQRLFFDPILSGHTVSCSSCHNPRLAFSDGLPKSATPGGGSMPRNAPGLSFAAYQTAQFWDLRAPTLEIQITHVVHSEQEFDSDFLSAKNRLAASPLYRKLFREAFDISDEYGGPVAVDALSKALAMYIRTLARWNSPFDRYARGETDTLDPAARRGFNLFMGKAACATCHFPPVFNGVVPPQYTVTESEVLGVPVRFPAGRFHLDPDPGRGVIHRNPIFQHSFKTPTVRNAAFTAPYMHNGSMETLEDVMDFYNAGGGQGLGLDVPNQTLPADSLGLTQGEMDDIVAFMKSLSDTTGYWSHGVFEEHEGNAAIGQ